MDFVSVDCRHHSLKPVEMPAVQINTQVPAAHLPAHLSSALRKLLQERERNLALQRGTDFQDNLSSCTGSSLPCYK